MFNRVLIAEDHESASISVQKTLDDLEIKNRDYVYYCDDALLRIKKGLKEEQPYDLLITDLSFEEDHREQQIKSGIDLIKAVKELNPNLKIIVFSAENNVTFIEMLFKELNINGYVRKARQDSKTLKQALDLVSKNKNYLSDDLRRTIREKNSYEFTEYDITIISLLSKGMHQKDIPVYLQQHNIKPFGLSSIEKRLSLIKEILEFSKNEQLVAYCKDFGVI